jgi:hypothetical protein
MRIVIGIVRMLASLIVVAVRMMHATAQPYMQSKGQRGSEADDRAEHSGSIPYWSGLVKLVPAAAPNRICDTAPSS